MSNRCLLCKAAVPALAVDGTQPLFCACCWWQSLLRTYNGSNVVLSCAGACGREQVFPEFLNVKAYLCAACAELAFTLILERRKTYEQAAAKAS